MPNPPYQRTFLTWLACANCVASLAAAEVMSDAGTEHAYRIAHWTSEDGLPSNRINALAQTRDGYLWAGTWFGLVRFDGVRFTVFNRYNTPAMVNDAVNALAEDGEGNLWIGTADGLMVLRDGRFRRFTEADGLSDRGVSRLIRSRAGGVWIEAGGNIVHWHKGRPTVTALVQGNPVRSLWENDDGSLRVVTAFGLRRVSRNGEQLDEPSPPGAPAGAWIGGCLIDRQKRYWLSSEARLSQFSQGAWHVLQRATNGADRGHFLYEDRSGCVWVSRGQAGFWRCDGNRVESVKLNEHVEDQAVTCMIEDREGHLWAGTPHGLYQLRSKLIRAFSTADGLPSDECWSVCEAPDGAIWVETKGGVARIQNEHTQTFAEEPSRGSRASVLVDSRNAVWLGNWHGGVVAWRPGVETNYFSERLGAPPGLGLSLDSLYLDRAGRVWVGTGYGVIWFENGQPAAKWGEFGLPTNSVRSIYQTRDGAMWFGTWQAGAIRWKGDVAQVGRAVPSAPSSSLSGQRLAEDIQPYLPEVTRFTTAHGLADDRVFAFHEDADGTLWIGTHNGLNRFKDGRFFTFRTEHGLLDNLINWLEEDDSGRLWFSCNRGIFRIDRSELNAVANGKKARANVAVYGTADGMLSPETNGEHQPAGCKDREGKLWFPTMQGVVVIDPRTLKDNDVPPLLVIEEVRANGLVVGGDGLPGKNPQSEIGNPKLKLPPGGARTLQIRYTANSFADPRRVRFRYRLAGHDNEWREETTERVAYYAGLRPGDYQFEVMAANPHGVWSEKGTWFAFSLAPHFWQTWMFYSACAAAMIGLGGAMHAYRLRWQRRLLKLEQQRALDHERTRIARDLHDDLGTALTGLALEMDVAGRDMSVTPRVARKFDDTAQHARSLADRMREVVWAVNPRCDNIPSLADFLDQQVGHILRSAGLIYRLELPEEIPDLPLDADVRHQLALCVREALTNVLRHARAKQVTVRLTISDQALAICIADDGIGFDSSQVNGSGHGLVSLRERLERIGGTFECRRRDRGGTMVTFNVPLKSRPMSE